MMVGWFHHGFEIIEEFDIIIVRHFGPVPGWATDFPKSPAEYLKWRNQVQVCSRRYPVRMLRGLRRTRFSSPCPPPATRAYDPRRSGALCCLPQTMAATSPGSETSLPPNAATRSRCCDAQAGHISNVCCTGISSRPVRHRYFPICVSRKVRAPWILPIYAQTRYRVGTRTYAVGLVRGLIGRANKSGL